MLQAYVITLREGLEAFLIIAISLAYLKKTGRRELTSAVHWGIGVSLGLSAGAAYLFQQAANQSFWEGLLALTAAVSVASLTVHMWRTAKRIKGEIEGRLALSAGKVGAAAWTGVFLFTLLMISREGMETALLFGTLFSQVQTPAMLIGAAAGTLSAAFVAFLWSRYGHRVNLALFFQVTAIFLLIFVAQLLIYGFHEMTEAHLFPNSEALHWATEPFGPDGVYGQMLSYLLLAGPLTWLLIAMARGSMRASAPGTPGRA